MGAGCGHRRFLGSMRGKIAAVASAANAASAAAAIIDVR
jgi:hypothetical protein